MDLTKSMKVL